MEVIRTIRLNAKEVKKDKQTFITCNSKIGSNWYKIKFRKECENAPKTRGIYELQIDLNNCSIEDGKYFTKDDGSRVKGNDTIWVRKIKNIRKLTEEELQEINTAKFNDIEW